MKIYCTIAILLFFSCISVKGQAPIPCTTGTENTCKCSSAPVLCTVEELDGFTYSMTSFLHPTDGPYQQGPGTECLCPGYCDYSSDNPTWFRFVAWCENIDLELCWSNCSTGNCGSRGIQASVFSECFGCPDPECAGPSWEQNSQSPAPYTYSVICETNGCGSNNGCETMNLQGLTIGKIYYFMVDGCCGSACDIGINVISECNFNGLGAFSDPITGQDTVCVGDTASFQSGTSAGANIYSWFVDGVFIDVDRLEPIELHYTFNVPGIYELCVTAWHTPCIPMAESNRTQCFSVNVGCDPPPPPGSNAANVAINNTGDPPHPSAMLDINSQSKGLLIPRMTKIQRDSILLPANGLLIYQTDFKQGFYFNANTADNPQWLAINDVSELWQLNQQDIFRVDGKVGIGLVNPKGKFQINEPVSMVGFTFTGTGLNDLEIDFSGFTETDSIRFIVEVFDGNIVPNLIRVSYDNGLTWTNPEGIVPNMDFGFGITGLFDNDNGHTTNDTWSFTVFPDYGQVVIVREGKVGIGSSNPDSSAVLDLEAQSKGFLPPRLTTQQRNQINNPAIGLVIYNTDINCLEWYNGTIWYNPCD